LSIDERKHFSSSAETRARKGNVNGPLRLPISPTTSLISLLRRRSASVLLRRGSTAVPEDDEVQTRKRVVNDPSST
jgi:hypothetical protein